MLNAQRNSLDAILKLKKSQPQICTNIIYVYQTILLTDFSHLDLDMHFLPGKVIFVWLYSFSGCIILKISIQIWFNSYILKERHVLLLIRKGHKQKRYFPSKPLYNQDTFYKQSNFQEEYSLLKVNMKICLQGQKQIEKKLRTKKLFVNDKWGIKEQ